MTADFASLIWIERKTMDFVKDLKSEDKEIFDAIAAEFDRQQNQIELIASENIVSKAVLEAQGSILTNKYAEGYPAKRYYRGCEFVDVVENLAIERAKKLFDARFVNVQPHSGAQAGEHRRLCGATETLRHDYGHVFGCGRAFDARFKGFLFRQMA